MTSAATAEAAEAAEASRYRVLYLPSWYPHPAQPTYAIFLRVQAECLSKAHELVVVPPPNSTSLWSSPRNWIDRCESGRSPGGCFEFHLSGPNYTPKFPGAHDRILWRLYSRSFREATHFFGAKPDLIHAQVSLDAGYYAARLAREYDCPLVLTEQISRPELLVKRDRERFLYAIHAPECVMALSPMQRDHLYDAGVQREIDVVPNAIDTNLFRPGPRPESPPIRLACVGNLIERKGFGLLLQAVAHLIHVDRMPLELEVVGTGALRSQLEANAAGLRIDDRVHFHGERSQCEVRDLLRRCNIYVSASLTESLGVAIIEGMSVGLPAVVTRCGGPESYVTPESGVIVEPGSVEELVRGIRTAVTWLPDFDSERQHRSIVERFSSVAMILEVTKRYTLAIERHAQASHT
jgi:glycosyltransferase involved in cell wall biosynthesis